MRSITFLQLSQLTSSFAAHCSSQQCPHIVLSANREALVEHSIEQLKRQIVKRETFSTERESLLSQSEPGRCRGSSPEVVPLFNLIVYGTGQNIICSIFGFF